MWDLIVSVTDHCLSFYFKVEKLHCTIKYTKIYVNPNQNQVCLLGRLLVFQKRTGGVLIRACVLIRSNKVY